MRKLSYVLLILLGVLATGCTKMDAPKWAPQPHDTLYTARAAMRVYDYNPDRALVIIDSAEIVGNLSHNDASFYRAKVFTMTLEGIHLDSAQKICLALINSDYVKNADNQESVLDLLVTISRRKQDFEQWLKWSTEKADFCRKYGNEVEALRTEAEIGVILTYLGRQDEGLQKLDYVISQLDGTRKFNEMDACIIALRRKVDVLQYLKCYEGIVPIAHKIIEKINDYEQHTDEYHDDSFREPSAANVPDYCEFYRLKAYAYLARAYAEIDDVINARRYLTLFENSSYGQTFDGRMMISTTWCRLGDYDKMLTIYDEVEHYLNGDTINETYSTILHNRAIAAEASGNYVKAYNYMSRYAELSDILNDDLKKSEAHEYAARYRDQEQRMEIERYTIQNRMLNTIIVIIFIALLIAVLLYNYTVFQKHELAKKNIALVKLIDRDTDTGDDQRLTKACKLLVEQPDMKIADVANKAGLTPRNLHKLFREQYGISPTEYRASHKK